MHIYVKLFLMQGGEKKESWCNIPPPQLCSQPFNQLGCIMQMSQGDFCNHSPICFSCRISISLILTYSRLSHLLTYQGGPLHIGNSLSLSVRVCVCILKGVATPISALHRPMKNLSNRADVTLWNWGGVREQWYLKPQLNLVGMNNFINYFRKGHNWLL